MSPISSPRGGPQKTGVALLILFLAAAILVTNAKDDDDDDKKEGDRDGHSDGDGGRCEYVGTVRSDQTWYGFLANITFGDDQRRVLFTVSYEDSACCPSLHFYQDSEVRQLRDNMTCAQKAAVLDPALRPSVSLTTDDAFAGCEMDGSQTFCTASREFAEHDDESPRHVWHLAVSNCDSDGGIDIEYNVTVPHQFNPCPGSQTDTGDQRGADVALLVGALLIVSGRFAWIQQA